MSLPAFTPLSLTELNQMLVQEGHDALQTDDPVASLVFAHGAFVQDFHKLLDLHHEAMTELLAQHGAETEERAMSGAQSGVSSACRDIQKDHPVRKGAGQITWLIKTGLLITSINTTISAISVVAAVLLTLELI